MEIPDNLTQQLNDDKMDNVLFQISGVSDGDRLKFFGFLDDLSVPYSTASGSEATCTHLIAQSLKRSEKLLGSMASGKWILHPCYMQDCVKEKKLLPAAKYEWIHYVDQVEDKLGKELASAANFWRLKVSRGECEGVYSGFKVIMHTTSVRMGQFARLIESGKGQIVDKAKKPFTDAAKFGVTHCIVEPSKVAKKSVDYRALALARIAVVGPMYLSEYLINCRENPPNIEEYLVDEFKPFWKDC